MVTARRHRELGAEAWRAGSVVDDGGAPDLKNGKAIYSNKLRFILRQACVAWVGRTRVTANDILGSFPPSPGRVIRARAIDKPEAVPIEPNNARHQTLHHSKARQSVADLLSKCTILSHRAPGGRPRHGESGTWSSTRSKISEKDWTRNREAAG